MSVLEHSESPFKRTIGVHNAQRGKAAVIPPVGDRNEQAGVVFFRRIHDPNGLGVARDLLRQEPLTTSEPDKRTEEEERAYEAVHPAPGDISASHVRDLVCEYPA